MAKYDNFNARALSRDFAKSRTKGTDYVSIMFGVVDENDKPVMNGGTQLTFEYQGYFTDATKERTIQSMRTAGFSFPNDDISSEAGMGSAMVQIQVEDGDYGKRVAWVNPPSKSSVDDRNRMSSAEKKGFAANLKGTIAMMRKGSPSATPAKAKEWEPPATTPANDASPAEPTVATDEPVVYEATGTDDDVPF